jgi:hypothetical protein
MLALFAARHSLVRHSSDEWHSGICYYQTGCNTPSHYSVGLNHTKCRFSRIREDLHRDPSVARTIVILARETNGVPTSKKAFAAR